MSAFITAIGLVLIIEGLLYGVFPSLAKRMAQMLEETPQNTIQTTGVIVALVGLVIVWLGRG